MRQTFKGNFSNKCKSEILNLCVSQTLPYGSQTWSLIKRTEGKLIVTQNAMERAMLNINKINCIRTQKVRRKLPYRKDLIQTIRNQYWNWAGHVTRMQDNRWTYLTTF